ncbi:MAG: protein-L-isoaspartate O-methyltransferase [Rhodospirillales bacterium]|nr:protein-L-isoaspartate O-methyltransferase [Rhodospirillales bacterium]
MDFDLARRHMVDSQLLPNRVTDERIIGAMARLPREVFVPAEFQGIAYVDEAVALDGGRFLMKPMVMGRLIQEALPQASDLALVVGCNTGYGAAIISHTVSTVVAVESDAGLAAKASETLTSLGIDTVAVIQGDLKKGCPEQAPYDVIFIDGAVAEIPDAISRQLADGGRLVAVVSKDGIGKAMLTKRHGDEIFSLELFNASTPYLAGFEPQKAFVF